MSSQEHNRPDNGLPAVPLPGQAEDLATLLAAGVGLNQAAQILSTEPLILRNWVTHPDFRELLRQKSREVSPLTKDEVNSLLQQYLPLVLQNKADILKDPLVDLKLKDKVGDDLIKMLGYGHVEKRQLDIFIHPSKPSEEKSIPHKALVEVLDQSEPQPEEET